MGCRYHIWFSWPDVVDVMTKIKDLHRRWSKDDDYNAAFDGLDEEFRLTRSLDQFRSNTFGSTRAA